MPANATRNAAQGYVLLQTGAHRAQFDDLAITRLE
jgi:hypothetical protein